MQPLGPSNTTNQNLNTVHVNVTQSYLNNTSSHHNVKRKTNIALTRTSPERHATYATGKQFHKHRTSLKVRKITNKTQGWLWANLKHTHYLLHSRLIPQNRMSFVLNSTMSKSNQTVYAKQKSNSRALLRYIRSRTKTPKHSRLYETGNSTRYAMTFQKTPLSTTNTTDVTKSFTLNLLFLTQNKHLATISRQKVNLSSWLGFTKYRASFAANSSAVETTTSLISLKAYANSITELFKNTEFQSLGYRLNPHMLSGVVNQNQISTHEETSRITTLPNQTFLPNQKHAQKFIDQYNLKMFNDWFLESRFVRPRSVASQSAVFILAKAPTYRMSRISEAPISTSQHYGNLYNKYSWLTNNSIDSTASPLFHNSKSPLLAKAPISASTMSFLRPYKNKLKSHLLDAVSGKMKNTSLKTLSTVYQNLLYASSIVAHSTTAMQSQQVDSSIRLNLTKLNLYKAINLKTKLITRRFFKKSQPNAASVTRKLIFSEDIRLISKSKKNLWLRASRLTYKRLSRFTKWKTKKSTFFFSKFRKLNKGRKGALRSLIKTNFLFNTSSKYQSSSLLDTRRLVKSKQQLLGVYTPNNTNTNTHNLIMNKSYMLGRNIVSTGLTHNQTIWLLLLNPFTLKNTLFSSNISTIHKTLSLLLGKSTDRRESIFLTNLTPHHAFRKNFSKKVLNSFANRLFREDIIPYYQNTLIRFMEYCTGRKVLFQFYPFVNQHIDKVSMVRYKRWLPRMNFYERRLGHKFFLEEALHIMHISFVLRDPKIIASWLKAIILRISFWKTRSIFRFLKYLFHNYFTYVFDDIKIKGLKIRLKGKISSAGNSRKRTILYRVGRTSHSEVNLRVVKDFSLINTFTGVMGFQVYLFY